MKKQQQKATVGKRIATAYHPYWRVRGALYSSALTKDIDRALRRAFRDGILPPTRGLGLVGFATIAAALGARP